jgi:CxxC motif-containing protein
MEEIFTSLVRIKGDRKHRVVSVKSSKEIDRSLFIEFSKVLGRIYVSIPIKIGDIICKNILNTGVDIICTKNIEKDNVDNTP